MRAKVDGSMQGLAFSNSKTKFNVLTFNDCMSYYAIVNCFTYTLS